MKLLVCGDRKWRDGKLIGQCIDVLGYQLHQIVIIEGGAPGADTLARQHAIKRGIMVIEVKAEWAKYGKAAGPIRNQKMLDDYKPDLVMAFHDNIGASTGTAGMIELAKEAGVPVRLITHENAHRAEEVRNMSDDPEEKGTSSEEGSGSEEGGDSAEDKKEDE